MGRINDGNGRRNGDLAATSAAAAAAAATGTAIFTRAGFIDSEIAAADLLAVGGLDRGVALSGAAHGDERETAGAAGSVIGHEGHFGYGAVLIKEVFEVVFGGIEGKISYVQFHMVGLSFGKDCPDGAVPESSGFKSPLKKFTGRFTTQRDKMQTIQRRQHGPDSGGTQLKSTNFFGEPHGRWPLRGRDEWRPSPHPLKAKCSGSSGGSLGTETLDRMNRIDRMKKTWIGAIPSSAIPSILFILSKTTRFGWTRIKADRDGMLTDEGNAMQSLEWQKKRAARRR